MNRSNCKLIPLLAISLFGILSAVATAQQYPRIVLNEFMASNAAVLADEDGDYRDWIELYNPAASTVNIGGWYLTDDPEDLIKWQFPATEIAPGGYLIVFASGKDRSLSGAELHANFRLSNGGEYLALVARDGLTVIQQFSPLFPAQNTNISFGLAQTATPFIKPGANATLHVPADGALGLDWTAPLFDDTTWRQVQTPIGFDAALSGGPQLSKDALESLAGYWPFDAGQGQLAEDFSKQGNDGQIYNCIWVNDDPDRPGAMLDFRGFSYVDIPAPVTELGAADFSISLWIKTAMPGTGLVAKSNNNGQYESGEKQLYIPGTGPGPIGSINYTGEQAGYISGQTVVTDNAWHHVAVTYEHLTGTERIYIDGQEDALSTTTSFNGTPDNPNDKIRLGFDTCAEIFFYFNGRMDDVSIWSSALSAADIAQLHAGAPPALSSKIFGLINSNVEAEMYEKNASSYLRVPFEVPQPAANETLTLRALYEDGFIAYLNGQFVASRNPPLGAPQWNSAAIQDRPIDQAIQKENINLTPFRDHLTTGTNILAFQTMNDDANNGEFLFQPELLGVGGAPATIDNYRFFDQPTPGARNGKYMAPAPTFSHADGAYKDSFSLTLETNLPDAVIRYTTNGALPSESSTPYSGPIPIEDTTQIRARVFAPDANPSPIISKSFLMLHDNLKTFTSDLPIVVMETFKGGAVPTETFEFTYFAIHEPVNGRSSFVNPPNLATRAGIHIRGSSTASQPKHHYALEAWDEVNADKDITPLGMPPESDWIFFAAYTFDRALLRNPLVYKISNQMGRYAVRTRFVELFINTGGGDLAYADYVGLYVFMEKIKQGENRVDIPRLSRSDNTQPDITGGYIFKIDRRDPGDTGFSAGGQGALAYVEPKEDDITSAQSSYLRTYINNFDKALDGPNSTDPKLGYAAWIDVDAWIDHDWINILTKNPDGLRLSTYIFKDRNGLMEMGPVWDFDRTMGCSQDSRASNPVGWDPPTDTAGFFTYIWWGELFKDPNFMQRFIDRYDKLRDGPFSVENMDAIVDSMALEIEEAQARNFKKWTAVPPRSPGWQVGEVNRLKKWLTDRVNWIDTQFVTTPQLSHEGGLVAPGFELSISVSGSSPAIYYTLDGRDPRRSGGAIDGPNAQLYTGPITISENSHVMARAHSGADWSAPVEGRYAFGTVADHLRITEIMYDPPALAADTFDKEAYEFIELRNMANAPISLVGVRIADGVDFEFAPAGATTLDAGAYAVVAADIAAFRQRYGGQGIEPVGAFQKNLSNNGENIVLEDAVTSAILEFKYDNSGAWPSRANGRGSSLELKSPATTPRLDYGKQSVWRSSVDFLGSPGRAGSEPIIDIVINEVLTHTDPPYTDRIELLNVTTRTIDLGNWYLSDSSNDYFKFRVPLNTLLLPGGYISFDESNFNPIPSSPFPFHFALNGAHGDSLYLLAANGDGTYRFSDKVDFGGAANGEAFGRWPNGQGELYPMIEQSFDSPNAGPRVGPLVISELHYHPELLPLGSPIDSEDLEFIEIYNPTDESVNLDGWRLRRGVDFDFIHGPVRAIAPRATLVVTPFHPSDPAAAPTLVAFRAVYAIDASVALTGPYSDKLDNDGESVELQRPDAPPLDEPEYTPHLIEDGILYNDVAPWPLAADGSGQSLHRQGVTLFGRDASSWAAAAPTPGAISDDIARSAPKITSNPPSSVTTGQRFTYILTALGYPTPTFSITSLPAWLEFDGDRTITGIPSDADLGASVVITITATNTEGQNQQEFTLLVIAPPPPKKEPGVFHIY